MERPNIKDFFAEKTDLDTVHKEYTHSPHLYSYASALDRYIDWLEDEIINKWEVLELSDVQEIINEYKESLKCKTQDNGRIEEYID